MDNIIFKHIVDPANIFWQLAIILPPTVNYLLLISHQELIHYLAC